jgi:hypothetical protein
VCTFCENKLEHSRAQMISAGNLCTEKNSVRNYAETDRFVCTREKAVEIRRRKKKQKTVANYEKCKSEKSETNTEKSRARFMKYNEAFGQKLQLFSLLSRSNVL